MRPRYPATIAAVCLGAAAIAAPPQPAAECNFCAPGIDTGISLTNEIIVGAPIKEVWDAFFTEEGRKAWVTPLNKVDLRVGGSILTAYDPDITLGDPGTIQLNILSFEPERSLTMRAVAPENGPFFKPFENTWSIIEFDPIATDRTHVRIIGLGWKDNEETQAVYKFFEEANDYTLNQLRDHFNTDKLIKDDQRVMQLLAESVGEWIYETTKPDGTKLLIRSSTRPGADKNSFIAQGWFGSDQGMSDHGTLIVWDEPGDAGISFLNVNQGGAVARGSVRLTNNNSIAWDWNETESDNSVHHYRIEMDFLSPNKRTQRIFHIADDGKEQEVVDFEYTRTEQLSERFKKLTNNH